VLAAWSITNRGYESAFEDDDPEVWLLLTVQGDQFAWRVCKATAELWSAQRRRRRRRPR
jgi:hypothetical protein